MDDLDDLGDGRLGVNTAAESATAGFSSDVDKRSILARRVGWNEPSQLVLTSPVGQRRHELVPGPAVDSDVHGYMMPSASSSSVLWANA